MDKKYGALMGIITENLVNISRSQDQIQISYSNNLREIIWKIVVQILHHGSSPDSDLETSIIAPKS